MSYPILLQGVLKKKRTIYPDLDKDEFFEFFTADTVLVDFDLSNEEIASGIIDGPQDGGIDGAYLFINRQLWTKDSKYLNLRPPVDIELILIQSKNQYSFREAPVDRIYTSLLQLLDPSVDWESIETSFRTGLVTRIHAFHNQLDELSDKFPNVSIRIYYCCKGTQPNQVVQGKANQLEKTLSQWTPTSFKFLGSRELYERSKQQQRLVRRLAVSGAPLSGDNSYIALSTLRDYVEFLTRADGKLSTQIFEANVRDYQGEIEVNREIARSLDQPSEDVDFWWLNNGVTVVADNAQFMNKRLTIENPRIVNGLQTSYEIYKFREKLDGNDERQILVRVIVEKDRRRRDKIIRATNRQTAMKHSSFRSTEPIHTEIEDYLIDKGFYYDRRKNYYKRKGKPARKIISIDRLAQGTMAVLLQEPHIARSSPTSVIKNDDHYRRIFSGDHSTHPLAMYGNIVTLMSAVDEYFLTLKSEEMRIFRNNLRYHVLMVLSWELNGGSTLPPQGIGKLDVSIVDREMVARVAEWVFERFKVAGAEDRTAKDAKFSTKIQDVWQPNT